MSFQGLKEKLGKRARNFSRSARRSFGVGSVSSDSDSEDEVYVRSNDPNPRRDDRASSPSEMENQVMRVNRMRKGRRRLERQQQAQAAQEQVSLQRQAAEFTHNFEINEMIGRINEYFEIDVDQDDPRIRFVIGQIVNAHGLTLHSLRLMRRSRILLSAVGDIAVRTRRNALSASDVVYTAGQAALETLLAAGRLASRGASAVTSRLPSWGAAALSYLPSLPSRFSSSQPRAPGQRARSPDSFLQVQGPPDLGFNQVFFHAPASEHQSVPFQSQAPPPPPPPPPASAPAVEEDDCSICMTPLTNNVVLTRCGHKFHGACVTPWLNSHGTCPMCRSTNPTPLVPAPAKRQRQAGGGLKKYRSKSKTRRLRKSRSKPRKSYKSKKPRCSSRRK
jgi:hypothetical protein